MHTFDYNIQAMRKTVDIDQILPALNEAVNVLEPGEGKDLLHGVIHRMLSAAGRYGGFVPYHQEDAPEQEYMYQAIIAGKLYVAPTASYLRGLAEAKGISGINVTRAPFGSGNRNTTFDNPRLYLVNR